MGGTFGEGGRRDDDEMYAMAVAREVRSDRDAQYHPLTQNATKDKKGGRNQTFYKILSKNMGRNTFSSLLLKCRGRYVDDDEDDDDDDELGKEHHDDIGWRYHHVIQWTWGGWWHRRCGAMPYSNETSIPRFTFVERGV